MIKIPTVLILGAGASSPYGFPSGSTLRDQICANLSVRDSKTFLELRGSGFDMDEISQFRTDLIGSATYSFLTGRFWFLWPIYPHIAFY
jgi:hypothetical protein